ncbi:MAG TPA: endo-1,4-beta-xylanase, partial [Micromonosporaceae bacterium]|nr:endo-1,4-beta-xylanase [Micromonosporaceae bacterium]
RMQVRGRALVSPSSIHSAWFGNLSGADALASALRTHVTGVLTHHRGQIASWNVVTEAFTETGALRRSSFERYLGASFIEQAFRLARAADPSAKLCYNDFGIEDIDRPKAMAVHRMIQDFKARGVPIDCVGLESHFSSASPVPANFARTLATFAALGVDVQLTELDVAGSGAAQADSYRRAVTACFVVPRCTGITIWGVRDSDSWRSADTPVLFDAAGNPKPAYYAVLSA